VARTVADLRCQVDPATCALAAAAESGVVEPSDATIPQDIPPFDRTKAYGLYRDLVQPVEGVLAGAETLYVTATGPLSGLPLGLLLTEAPQGGPRGDANSAVLAGSKWLADKYALVTLPSVSSLRALGALRTEPGRLALAGFGNPALAPPPVEAKPAAGAEKAPNAGKPAPRGVRAFHGAVTADGLALADTAILKTLPSLPATETELRTMAAALGAPGDSLHLGLAATEAAVKTSADLAQARVVIFATHGLLPRELVAEPGLVFTPPSAASAEDDGVLTASEAARLQLVADWVILSACNTAAADGRPGAESLSGLAKAFLYAGARALLASHWRVADDSTSVLTVQTLAIQAANPALTSAQALQAAMKAVRTGTLPDGSALPGWDPLWAHPAAWAPFALVSAGT
jgi:CHAT domain-containing protein